MAVHEALMKGRMMSHRHGQSATQLQITETRAPRGTTCQVAAVAAVQLSDSRIIMIMMTTWHATVGSMINTTLQTRCNCCWAPTWSPTASPPASTRWSELIRPAVSVTLWHWPIPARPTASECGIARGCGARQRQTVCGRAAAASSETTQSAN